MARVVHYVPLVLGLILGLPVPVNGAALVIQLPAEVNAFRQDTGAELANAQCLICHSVEYVSTQPLMGRAFWKSSVQKMQQKYGAAIPEEQIELLVDYLTRNYGSSSNSSSPSVSSPAASVASGAPHSQAVRSDGIRIATRYGCFGCHNTTTKIVGPAYREIAAKYKSDPEAASKIEQQIHKGGAGKWGPIIMPPFPQVTAAETKTLTDWILSLTN